VDFLTLHCGVNRQALAALRADPRLMGVVSRGGTFHCAMMIERDEENRSMRSTTISLRSSRIRRHDQPRDGMRPGCLQDAEKLAKSVEYMTLGTLAKRLRLPVSSG